MNTKISQAAPYALAASASFLALGLASRSLQQWERVNNVAKGVFVLSVFAIACKPEPTKEDVIATLKALRGGELTDLSNFAHEDDKQFWKDWKRDDRTEEDLGKHAHQGLIKKYFHQGLGNAVIADIQRQMDLDQWDLRPGICQPAGFDIQETDDTLKIIYTGTLQLLDDMDKTPLFRLTSTLTVDVETERATSFVYTLDPIDETD